jgi:hypothetical protein
VGKQLDLIGGQLVFEKPRTLVIAAVGRGGGDRLSSGGAASALFGPTEKPVWSDRETGFVTYLQLT